MSLPSFKNSRQVREHTLAGIKAFSERQSRKEEKFTELETCVAALENDIFWLTLDTTHCSSSGLLS